MSDIRGQQGSYCAREEGDKKNNESRKIRVLARLRARLRVGQLRVVFIMQI